MNNVKQLLRVKGTEVWTISKNSSVMEALEIMAEKKVGSLIVDDGDNVVGIFTERDHARKVGLLNRKPGAVEIHEVMTPDLITVSPTQSVRECMKIMTESRVRHLPVFEDGKMVGIVSIGDVVRDLIEELEFLVEQLQNYIKGLS
jgi:CBS domain-containing protein